MELVELIKGHFIEQTLGFLYGEEVADRVKHQSPPMEVRTVLNGDSGNVILNLNYGWQQLPQSSNAIDNAAIAVGSDADTLCCCSR